LVDGFSDNISEEIILGCFDCARKFLYFDNLVEITDGRAEIEGVKIEFDCFDGAFEDD